MKYKIFSGQGTLMAETKATRDAICVALNYRGSRIERGKFVIWRRETGETVEQAVEQLREKEQERQTVARANFLGVPKNV